MKSNVFIAVIKTCLDIFKKSFIHDIDKELFYRNNKKNPHFPPCALSNTTTYRSAAPVADKNKLRPLSEVFPLVQKSRPLCCMDRVYQK